MTLLAELITSVLLAPPTLPEMLKLKVDGIERTAVLFRPKNKVEHPRIYFVYHGLGGTGGIAALQFRIHDLDPNAAVIYPTGIPINDNGVIGKKNGWQIRPRQSDNRDIKFLDQMVKWTTENLHVDPKQRYILGHSNGSFFTWVVLRERPEAFARYVGFCGLMVPAKDKAPAKPALVISGSDDTLIPTPRVKELSEHLAANNNCDPSTGTNPIIHPGNAPVIYYEYNGGHSPTKESIELAVRFCRTGEVTVPKSNKDSNLWAAWKSGKKGLVPTSQWLGFRAGLGYELFENPWVGDIAVTRSDIWAAIRARLRLRQ